MSKKTLGGPFPQQGIAFGTIVIPAYNCAGTIVRALDSVMKSIEFFRENVVEGLNPFFRVVVVDDRSTDNTVDVVREWNKDRNVLTLVLADKNRGAGPARNLGAALAVGEYLFFLDADDEFLPPHVYGCIYSMLQRPNAGYIKTSMQLEEAIHPQWKDSVEYSIVHNMCVRIPCHEFIEGFMEMPELKVWNMEDCFYNLMMERFFYGYKVYEETIRYYRHPGNNFDRQFEKFQRPMKDAPDDLTPAQKEVKPILWASFEDRKKRLSMKSREGWNGPVFKEDGDKSDARP